MNQLSILYTTIPADLAAEAWVEPVIKQGLAACVNVFSIQSVYQWEDHIEKQPEYGILFKLLPARLTALIQWIEAHHPYEVPAIWWSEVPATKAYLHFVMGACSRTT